MSSSQSQPVLTPKSAIGDIIVKLEKASGPDRGLDATIHVALDIRPDWCRPGTLWIDKKSDYGEGPAIRLNALGGRNSPGNPPIGDYPRYTESLDASLALVEEKLPGWLWAVGSNFDKSGKFAECDLYEVVEGESLREWHSQTRGATPPLAVLLALFKALEAK